MHNPMYDKIATLNILDVLDKVWLHYQKIWYNTYGIVQDGKLTDWRKVNIKDNYVNDMSHDRATWPPYAFIKKQLNLRDNEVYLWFKDKFNLQDDPHSKYMKSKWTYMKSRKFKKSTVTRPYSRCSLNDNTFL